MGDPSLLTASHWTLEAKPWALKQFLVWQSMPSPLAPSMVIPLPPPHNLPPLFPCRSSIPSVFTALLPKLVATEAKHFGGATASKRVIVVGGGAAGCELSFGLRARWKKLFPAVDISMTLLHRGSRVMDSEPSDATRLVEQELKERCIDTRVQCSVRAIHAGSVELQDGSSLPADIVVWATGAEAHDLLTQPASAPKASHLPTLPHSNGFLIVNNYLQVQHCRVFSTVDILSSQLPPTPLHLHLPPFLLSLLCTTPQSTACDRVFGAGDCVQITDTRVPKVSCGSLPVATASGGAAHSLCRRESMQCEKAQC